MIKYTKDKVVYFIYFILVFTSIFQDLVFYKYIGEFGRALTGLITVPIFLTFFILKKKIFINIYVKKLIWLELYLIIVNIISIIIYQFIEHGDLIILGENIAVKAIKGNSYFIVIILYLILLTNIQKDIEIKKMFNPFVSAFFFIFIILIIELFTKPNALPLIHNDKFYWRIRLTTSESSTTSSLIVALFIPTLFYYSSVIKNKFMTILSFAVFIIFVITSSSRGFQGALLIALLIIIFKSEVNIKIKLMLIALFTVSFYFLFSYIIESFISDIEIYTSLITRVYTSYIGLIYGIIYPFGTGNAMYLIHYPKILLDNLSIINKIDIEFNLTEIYSYIYGNSDSNISAKTSILQYNMYWGIVGTIYFLTFYYKIFIELIKSKIKNKFIIEYGYIFILVLVFSTIALDIKYEVWAFLSLSIYLLNNRYCIKEVLKN